MKSMYDGYADDYKGPKMDGDLKAFGDMGFELMTLHDGNLLKDRRVQLGMTQQQVADAAKIQLRQYQRLESGERSMSSASMRIGLAICDVLRLDYHRFVPDMQFK